MVPNSPPELPIRDVVLAVIVRDRQVLIARRREQDPFGEYWELPGGKRRADETVLDCLFREVREELAVAVRPGHAFPPIVHAYPDITVRLLAIACEIDHTAEPRPLAADALKWATADMLRIYRFPPANAPLIEHIVRYLENGDE